MNIVLISKHSWIKSFIFTRQNDWLTKTTWDKAHAIPCVWPLKKLGTFSSVAKKIHLRKELNSLFASDGYFEASERTCLQGKGVLLKLL